MRSGFHISLRPGEKIYVNGAVLRVDRKVSIEFLNEVTFLLESHVIMAEQTTTPLRQLYFIVQTMLIDPAAIDTARQMYETSHALLIATFENAEILAGLGMAYDFVAEDKVFEALKKIRSLFPIEHAILAALGSTGPSISNEKREVA